VQKVKKTSISTKTGSSAKNVKPKRASGKNTSARKTSPVKKKVAKASTTKQKTLKSKKSIKKKVVTMGAKQKKSSPISKATDSVPNAAPRLLRQTKSSAAALKHLEKGIELIFKKNFKKARVELNALFNSYTQETEILARARSYVRICERKESSLKKTEPTKDQLYALGVLEHNKANYDEALTYYLQSLKIHPNLDYIYYSIAASQAMKGDLKESLDNLKKAIELNEDSRIYARNDEDFSGFEESEEFAELVGISQDQDPDSQ